MSDMQQAYQLAAHAVRQRLVDHAPEQLERLNALEKSQVTVFAGTYDHVQHALDLLGIPYLLSKAEQRLQGEIFFCNCTGDRKDKRNQALKLQVEQGAWLVSSDWCLETVVEALFPTMVRRKTRYNTGDEVISVEPTLESLWKDVVVLGTDPQWWLETSSYPIDIVDTERVRVDAASHELLVKYDAPAVAVQFDWKAGHVFHVISHFWLQRSRVPRSDYERPCTDFLRLGMNLNEDSIRKVLTDANVKADDLNFAMLQSAATSSELITQLCLRATATVMA